MVVQGEPPSDGAPPPPLGESSWEEAITGMIDDEFNVDDDFDANEDTEAAQDAIADVFGGGPPPMSDLVPENILQPAPTGDSSPLIILDSLESVHTRSASENGNNIPQDNSACLDVVSSDSSKGSQGSYADQVPSLSQSGSTGAQAAIEAKRSDLGSPWTLPSDDNSSSSKGGDSPKEAPLVVSDAPPGADPGAEDMDFFAQPAPVLVSHPTSHPDASEPEALRDSNETSDSEGASNETTEIKDETPESKDATDETTEIKDETPESKDATDETTETQDIKIQPPATETPEEYKSAAVGKAIVPESPMGSAAPFDEEPMKPGKTKSALTIKTSFSTEPPAPKDSLQEAMQESNDSEDSNDGPSVMSDVSEMVSRFTGVRKDDSEDLDDILGQKGKPILSTPRNKAESSMLSPNSDMAGIFSLRSERTEASVRGSRTEASNRTDRSEPLPALSEAPSQDSDAKRAADPVLLAASQRELEALTGTQETASVFTHASEPSLAELQSQKTSKRANATSNPLDRIVASLETYGAQQTRPHPLATPKKRAFIGPARSDDRTTFDSPASFQTSASGTPVSAVSRESDQGGTSFWSNSAGESETQGGTSIGESFSRTGTSLASPAGTSIASPANTSVASPAGTSTAGSEVSRASYASDESETDVSRVDTLSPSATSVSQSVAHRTFSTAATDTFHTRGTYQSNALSMQESAMSRGDSLSDRTSISQSATDQTETERTRTDVSGVQSATSAESDVSEESRGGRLWELANKEAERQVTKPLSPESSRFAESLMARTRSRADPDALVNSSASIDRDPERPNMVKIGEQDEENFIVHTVLARKRVRVVQLLIVGLVALLVSFLGNLWIQSSCHFVSAAVEVGDRGQVFDLHYGLWKYSPIDSAFQGYAYCFQYDDEYTGDAPLFSRWFSCLALVGGSFSLAVLWIYLIFGRGNTFTWDLAVYTAGMSGCLQIATLIILAGPVCQRDECSLGPAGILSIVASVVYFILAFEMYYNTPMASWVTDLSACPSSEQPGNLMANLEMTDFKHGAKAYVSRIVAGDSGPSLNQIQRVNRNPIGEAMLERDLSRNPGGYSPPAVLV
eukprot:CAMPEP_0117072254 /NCGR_PEP_ID=MMETSP0472-20121206/50855_1 /TAXON_ID=693140 ORGANISM="Tiarina fusus, Strain LIS" /NCGR_SAMPLE_ID=MMETSP0472 /ASSEMBLY_ACC=CAM_ASM_000603 /LENGTH=1085 /DNA_ID=CAMNT_0004796281 /DNA_START=84 /DNA_END=3341 /DNA_ORIENTATION=+